MITPALYARVSSEKQVQENTIASQLAELKDRILMDGFSLLEEYQFIDNGYSGSNLVRPALEKLRDQVSAGVIDKIYIHSPDRLSRKYAYQMILIEEFEKCGVDVIFLNCDKSADNPESHLLLQMQGMIAEYERSKIMERNRRGRIYAAKRGSANVLSRAPYGYRYIDKHTGQGEASFEIIEEEAQIIRKIFNWIGKERLTIGAVIRLLKENKVLSKKGNKCWSRTTIACILKNPAYMGEAAYGKNTTGPRLFRVRAGKGSSEQPRNNVSRYRVEKENWIYIPVPAIIDNNLFDAVQEQITENKKRARSRKTGATYLLQGLLVCKCCGRAYCGTKITKPYKSISVYFYYHCAGAEAYRFGGNKMCNSKAVRGEAIELIVWEEIKKVLKDPKRIYVEYQRRLVEINSSPIDDSSVSLEKRKVKLEKGISLLIDSYAQQYITKDEFEPRVKSMKDNLKVIQEQKNKLMKQKDLVREVELAINNLESFISGVITSLDNLDWLGKRDIIRRVVKRIEVDHEELKIVYKINKLSAQKESLTLQHCSNGFAYTSS